MIIIDIQKFLNKVLPNILNWNEIFAYTNEICKNNISLPFIGTMLNKDTNSEVHAVSSLWTISTSIHPTRPRPHAFKP